MRYFSGFVLLGVLASGADAQSGRLVVRDQIDLSRATVAINQEKPLAVQVVLRAQDGLMPEGFEGLVQRQLETIVGQYDQPSGGRTVVRLNGVWQPHAGQWKLSLRVVADHLIIARNTWTRLGDSQTIVIFENPEKFGGTVLEALEVAVEMAIMGEFGN